MTRKIFLTCILAAVLSATLPNARAAETQLISTLAGPVLGEVNAGIASFKGIPYAQPPVDALRWAYTRPHAAWTQPRDSRKFSPVCPQPVTPVYGDLGPSSEDCLYLNVWSGAKVTGDKQLADEKRPVLFWIHGGGFSIGAASQPIYDGTHLAQDGAVIVTFNYRLGPLGFLAHTALTAETKNASGNYGLRDMCEALVWTKNNIRSFGGDPDNITVWGESAGGAAVVALMASELPAHASFQRAIVMSTNTIVPQRLRSERNGDLQSMEELGLEFQMRLQVPNGPDALEQMRAKTPTEILKASRPGSFIPGVSTTDNLSVDGLVLREPLIDRFRQASVLRIPLMIGNVADEGSTFERKAKIDSVAQYTDFLAKRYGEKAQKAFAVYTANSDAEVRPALESLFTDIFFRSTRMHARSMRTLLTGTKAHVYVYDFTRKAKPMVDSGWGVYHGSEVPFFFGSVDDKLKYTDEDRELSRLIRTYLVAFARDGDPNAGVAPRAPDWPPFDGEEQCLVLDTPISIGKNLRADTLDKLKNGALAKDGQSYP